MPLPLQPGPDRTLNYVRTVARLARIPDLRVLSLAAAQLVMAMRLRPIFDYAERDAAAELAMRFRSVPAALAALALGEQVCAAWPEAFALNRPCCVKLTPDEHTLAQMARAAAAGDRAGFSALLDGFVRTSRHDRLFDATVRALAALAAANPS
ncbi:MAG: hypothetical protein LC648_01445 [Novosphingobium sp.]|nr:hypothetical protein [Novosphingobium sp.]